MDNKDFGGIYVIQYTLNPEIFYIGRSVNFKKRIYLHSLKTIAYRKQKYNHKNPLYEFV